MRIDRLFEIVYILIDKKRVTTQELAAHFEVSKRTILRDIEALTIAGIPIYTSKGKGGGISILDNFVFNKTTISDEEQNQIIFALQSLAPTQYANTNSILSKLSSLFAKTVINWIEVDFSGWGNTDLDNEKFEKIKMAILDRQAITFSYASPYGELSIRTVYPLKLLFKSRAWYLYGYCLLREDYRLFKINRMTISSIEPYKFEHETASMLPIKKVNKPVEPVTLKLRFLPKAASRVYDEFHPKEIIRNEDGSLTVATTAPHDDWLYNFLLSFGATVQIIEPYAIRVNLLCRIDEMKNFINQT